MLPDENIRNQLSEGNEKVLYSLMSVYYNDLFRYGVRFTADAESTKDIVNQFFLHIWERRDQFGAAENLKAYLIVSFKRFLINYLRKSFPFHNIAEYPDELIEHSYEDHIIALQQDELLKKALQQSIHQLPNRQRELLVQRFYENLSYEEIASRNSLTVRTVYNKIHLALKKLRTVHLLQHIRKSIIARYRN